MSYSRRDDSWALPCEWEVAGLVRLWRVFGSMLIILVTEYWQEPIKSLSVGSSGWVMDARPTLSLQRSDPQSPLVYNNEDRKPSLQKKCYVKSGVGSSALNKKKRGHDWSAALLISQSGGGSVTAEASHERHTPGPVLSLHYSSDRTLLVCTGNTRAEQSLQHKIYEIKSELQGWTK